MSPPLPRRFDRFREVPIAKVDTVRGLIFGWAIVCKTWDAAKGALVDYFDLQKDHIPEETMLDAAVDFFLGKRVAGEMHRKDAAGQAVDKGCVLFGIPMTADMFKSIGVDAPMKTGLLIGMKPSDPEIVKKAARGEYTGFSIGGLRGIDELAEKGATFFANQGQVPRSDLPLSFFAAALADVVPADRAPAAFLKELGETDDSVDAAKAKQRTIMRSFVLREISPVDVPAQEGAGILMTKRGAGGELVRVVAKTPMLTTDTDGHAHLIDDFEQGGETSYNTAEGDDYGHYHAWVRNADGTYTIGASSGHTHTIRGTSKRTPTEDNVMSTTDLQTQLTAALARVTALEGEVKTAKAFGRLTDTEKLYAATLDDDTRPVFVAKSAGERQAEVKANIEYTDAGGHVYFKSDPQRTIDTAKRADAMEKRATAAEETASMSELTKRAAAELPSGPGSARAKALLLKAAEGAVGEDGKPSEALKGEMIAYLRAGEAGMSGVYDPVGFTNQGGGEPAGEVGKGVIPIGTQPAGGGGAANPEQAMEAMAQKYAREHKVDLDVAYDAVSQQPEFGKIYARDTAQKLAKQRAAG